MPGFRKNDYHRSVGEYFPFPYIGGEGEYFFTLIGKFLFERIDQKMCDLFFYNGFIFFHESFILNGLSIGIGK